MPDMIAMRSEDIAFILATPYLSIHLAFIEEFLSNTLEGKRRDLAILHGMIPNSSLRHTSQTLYLMVEISITALNESFSQSGVIFHHKDCLV